LHPPVRVRVGGGTKRIARARVDADPLLILYTAGTQDRVRVITSEYDRLALVEKRFKHPS